MRYNAFKYADGVASSMIVEKQIYTIDDVRELAQDPANDNVLFELIDGELFRMTRPNRQHGLLASEIAFFLRSFTRQIEIGEVVVESGHHPPDYRYTLLGPDVAFTRYERIPDSKSDDFYPVMPDLAVEVLSPSESLNKARQKAEVYLRNGTSLVWLVQPDKLGVEVCRLIDGSQLQIEFVSHDGSLSGGAVLPGFELSVKQIFAVLPS